MVTCTLSDRGFGRPPPSTLSDPPFGRPSPSTDFLPFDPEAAAPPARECECVRVRVRVSVKGVRVRA